MVSSCLSPVLMSVAVFTGDLAKLPSVDWGKTDEVRPGVKLVKFELDAPRLMKAYCLRCDLKGRKFGYKTTVKSANYGKVFLDTDGKSKCVEHTQRNTTRNFINDNPDVVVAVNVSPWRGGVDMGNLGEMPAEINGVTVLKGETVSDYTLWTNVNFVIRKDGVPDIRCGGAKALSKAQRADLDYAFMGYGWCLKKGKILGKADKCHPRTVYGLSADRRYLYLLTVDGRQPGWSEGADNFDLARLMLALGADDAINMDGGGSCALFYRDPKSGRPVQLNRHDAFGFYARPVALNLGLIEK